MAWSFVIAFILGTILKKLGAFRVSEEAEITGVDETEHAETAYSFTTTFGTGTLTGAAASHASAGRD